MADPIEKVSIVVSRGSLEGVYPGLIMANGARMEGIEATLFFTFFGLEVVQKDKLEKLHIAKVLYKTNYNKNLSCKILNLPRTTLWRKMKKYGLLNKN